MIDPSRRIRAVLCGMFALCMLSTMTSCGAQKGGTLTGSLLDFYDAEYSTVRARLYSSELAIEYVREDGEVPLRVTILRDANLISGKTFELPGQGNMTGRVGDTDLPELSAAKVTLDTFEIVDGTRVVGTFSSSFRLGMDTASLSGEFDTELEVVDKVQGYPHDFGTDLGEMGEEMGEAIDED